MTFKISTSSGEDFSFGGQIRKPQYKGQPPPWQTYPSSAAGHVLTFTAKRRKQDPLPLVQIIGTVVDGGMWTVEVDGSETSGFARAEELLFDVVLDEPGGATTVICKGEWEIEKSVGL